MLTRQTIEPKAYRDAMARYAGHVQIATTEHQGVRRGVTVTAACSVSDNPGTVLVCLNHSNPKNALFAQSGRFALNSLTGVQQHLAAAFSGETHLDDRARFDDAQWDVMISGAPTLIGASAVFDCRLVDMKSVATHTVFFGEVIGIRIGENKGALIYMDRGYHKI